MGICKVTVVSGWACTPVWTKTKVYRWLGRVWCLWARRLDLQLLAVSDADRVSRVGDTVEVHEEAERAARFLLRPLLEVVGVREVVGSPAEDAGEVREEEEGDTITRRALHLLFDLHRLFHRVCLLVLGTRTSTRIGIIMRRLLRGWIMEVEVGDEGRLVPSMRRGS